MGKYIIELPENTHWIQWIMEGTKDHHPYILESSSKKEERKTIIRTWIISRWKI